MPATLRLFVAVRPSPAAVEHLDDFLEVRRAAGDLRWTAAEQLHLTLAFLPAVPEHALDELGERLGDTAARRTAFPARITGGGAFPDAARARVLWAGVGVDAAGGVQLERLAGGCRGAANHAGAVVDGTRFQPHLTVARTRRPEELTRWVRLLDGYAGPSWSASEVELVASHLGEGPRGRPRHVTIATFPLAGGADR